MGDTRDSRFEAIIEEIILFRPPSCANHNTLNVSMSLRNKPPVVLVLSQFNAVLINTRSKCVIVSSLSFNSKYVYV